MLHKSAALKSSRRIIDIVEDEEDRETDV